MNLSKIKETMDNIHMSEKTQKEIIENVKKRIEDKKNKTKQQKIRPLIAASIIIVILLAGIPIYAGIQSLVKTRMENMPKDEIKNTQNIMSERTSEADIFSREYSQSERERMAKLYIDYNNGKFPQKEITVIDSKEQPKKDLICYIKDTSFFYLPEHEMTDEELLEIIDFNYKREYSVSQSGEASAIRENFLKEQKQFETSVIANGGISKEEALNTATELLKNKLNMSVSHMTEKNVCLYYDNDLKLNIYTVTYGVRSCYYYYFDINAEDGSLIRAVKSSYKGIEELTSLF